MPRLVGRDDDDLGSGGGSPEPRSDRYPIGLPELILRLVKDHFGKLILLIMLALLVLSVAAAVVLVHGWPAGSVAVALAARLHRSRID